MIACTWDHPGADRYTGSVPAAIAAYGLPLAAQSELIRKFEARQFDDSVVIDRDSIRGQQEYYPAILSMHFGSRGQHCDPTRDGWKPDHTETALVVCTEDGTECIAWPAVCGNVFRITRAGGDKQALGVPETVDYVPAAPALIPLVAHAPTPMFYGGGGDYYAVGGGGGGGFGGGGGGGGGSCCCAPPPPGITTPVPEPTTWALLLAGGLLGALRLRRTNRGATKQRGLGLGRTAGR